MRAAVTGGTGLIGSVLVDILLESGWRVSALARDPQRVKRANDIKVVRGDLSDESALAALADGADAFFHFAGVTHARDIDAYREANVDGSARAARAAAAAGAGLIHISSLSARAPHASPYARSKRDSEAAVAEASGGNPWRALRLPAIYGPGDRATLPYFKLVRAGLAMEPRTQPAAKASLLYVRDAALAAIAAQQAPAGGVYEVGDDRPEGREWAEIGRILGKTFGKSPLRLRIPRPAVSALHRATMAFESMAGKPPSIRPGQANEFFHPDWVARANLLSEACDWAPQTPLEEGFAKTVRWYQENNLL